MPNETSAPTLTLALVDDDPSPSKAGSSAPSGAPARPPVDLRITNADEFLAAAIAEYEAGRVDEALWTRSAATTGGDEALTVAAYLRARATALRLERRDARRQAAPAGSDAPVPPNATARPVDATPPAHAAAARDGRVSSRGSAARRARRWKIAAMAGAGFVVATVVAVTFLARSPVAPAAPAAATADARKAATHAVSRATQNVQAQAVAAGPSLADRVADLKRANNWNVLVLYATEWTRKEPGSADAWRELAQGYAHLNQLPEAFEAAGKRAAVAGDADAWSDVGRYAVMLERWPEAAAAYDKVLALRADDGEALCGSALAARRAGRAADADALARRVSAAGQRCDDAPSAPVTTNAALPASAAVTRAPATGGAAAPGTRATTTARAPAVALQAARH